MKRTIIAVMACLLLGGYTELFAKDLPSCLDPESKEYSQPAIGGLCEKCGKTFTFSGDQLNNKKIGNCPYCKCEQSLKDACNRYGAAYLPKIQKKAE